MATMITRTVVGTSVTAKVVSKTTDEVTTLTEIVSKEMKDEKEAIKYLSKVIDEDYVIIRIENMVKIEKLYGMTINDFMLNAVELDPTTRKPLETSNN